MDLINRILLLPDRIAGKEIRYTETPTVLQMESVECGAASLTMIMGLYGLWVPLEKMRELCGVNRDGASMASLLRAAKALGCEAKGKRYKPERLKEIDHPVILFWEFNHFLVYEGFVGDDVLLNDPAAGHRRVPWKDFIASYTGVALDIVPGENFKPGGKKYSIVENLGRKLLKDRAAAAFVLLASLFLLVPNLAAPAFNQVFVDDIMSGKYGANITEQWRFNLFVLMGVAVFLLLTLTALQQNVLLRWLKRLVVEDSGLLFKHMLHLPMAFYQQRSPSEVATRVDMNSQVAETITTAATSLLSVFTALFYLTLLSCYNFFLTLIALLFNLLSIATFLIVNRKMQETMLQLQMEQGKSYAAMVSGLMMMDTLKANGTENDFFSRWTGLKTKAVNCEERMHIYGLVLQSLPMLFAGLTTALLMTFGGFSVMDGAMSAGAFLAFNNLVGNFREPVDNLLAMGSRLPQAEMLLKRIDDVMRYPEDELNFPDRERREKLEADNLFPRQRFWGELELRHIKFGYNRTKEPLFADFNLRLRPGEWAALVGGSGCGKSTIAKIILGICEEWEGELLFDGVRRRDIPRAVICNSVASVDQDIFLMEGTVRDNITMFDSSVPNADIVQAAKDACIYDDIMKLPEGFQFKLKEGGRNFSGGQRQRLELARALATNPSVLVLDEATSALDPLTEEKIISNIRHRGCTCILVAHRLSTIRDCDEIIVIDHGQVTERGSHTELMRLQGAYARLVSDNDTDRAEGGGAV